MTVEAALPRAATSSRARDRSGALGGVALVRAGLALLAVLVAAAFVAAGIDLARPAPRLGLLTIEGRVVLLQPGGAAWQAGLRLGDAISAIDGAAPSGTSLSALSAHSPGDVLAITEGGPGSFRLYYAPIVGPSPAELSGDIAALVAALALWLAGLWAGLPRRRAPAARIYAACAFSLALALAALALWDGVASWPRLAFGPALLAGLCCLILSQSDMAGIAARRLAWLLATMTVAGAMIVLLSAVATLPAMLGWVAVLITATLALAALLGPLALHARTGAAPRRRRLRVALFAGLLGLLPPMLWPGLDALGALLGRQTPPWASAAYSPLWSTIGLIPLALLYGALAQSENPRRLDTHSRTGLSYLSAALGLGVVALLGASLHGAASLALIAAACLAFPFVQQGVAALLRRVTTPPRPAYALALRRVEELATVSIGPGELAHGIVASLPEPLCVRGITLLLKGFQCSADLYRVVATDRLSDETVALDASLEAHSADEARPIVPPDQALRGAETLAQARISLWAPLWWDGAQRGALALGPRLVDDAFGEDDVWQIAVLCGVLALAFNGQELAHHLRERASTMVTLTQHLSEAHEQERAHLSRELHDVVAQDLIALTRQLRRYGADQAPPPAIWADMLAAAQDALTATRRICNGLRPAILDLGLLPALRDLVADIGEREGAAEISLTIEGEEQRLPAEVEFTLFRVAQEGLNNALAHSGARQVRLEVCFGDSVRLRLRDDGHGFVTPRRLEDLPGDHLGLIGMRERLARFGGTLTITSAPGEGTMVEARLPLNQ